MFFIERDGAFALSVAGVKQVFNRVECVMSKRVLVVCVGNICRSPMAEVLFRHHVPGIAVSSAGIFAMSGCRMDPTALAVLHDHGLDGRAHVAAQLYDNLVFRADLVLGVERAHVKMLKDQVPQVSERIFLLDRYSHQDIPDPFRQQRRAFDKAYDMIDAAVKAWVPELTTDDAG